MIIAEATTKSGKLVRLERDKERWLGLFQCYWVFIDGYPELVSIFIWPAKSYFFQACQEGCEQ